MTRLKTAARETTFSHDHITATRATLAINGIGVITFELAGNVSFV